ncbi:MAG: flagellar export protein FliJ [Candidatus Bruticola sp.]
MAQKRFRYRLQQILELKIQAEEDEKEKLAKLIQQQENERQIKAQLEQKLVSIREELKVRQANGTLDINQLRFFPQHIEFVKGQIVNQELRIKELTIRIAQQREALMKAAQERQSYEKNKEKSQEKWLAEIEQEENKMLDELATLKYARDPSAT